MINPPDEGWFPGCEEEEDPLNAFTLEEISLFMTEPPCPWRGCYRIWCNCLREPVEIEAISFIMSEPEEGE